MKKGIKKSPTGLVAALALSALLVCGLSGCTQVQELINNFEDGWSAGDVDAGDATGEGETDLISSDIDIENMDFDYSNRDSRSTYENDDAAFIHLSGTTATVTAGTSSDAQTASEGIEVNDGIITISAAGIYVLDGTFQGQIYVKATDSDKIQLVLNGANITCSDGPAINIKKADKVFITLVEGTTNTLTDGATYALEEGEDEPYATLYSKADLSINGTGALVVNANYRHGIVSKDDLVIMSGTITVTAKEDGIRGRDALKIDGGTFTIVANDEGLSSNNDEDADKGYISITGGTFTITTTGKAIAAEKYLRIEDGTFTITSTDDALHSNCDVTIDGGTFAISTEDDGVHAEEILTINGGTINVSKCYEGFEGVEIYVNGGTHHIVASDDAINAAGGNSTDADSWTGGLDSLFNRDPANSASEGDVANESYLIKITGGTLYLVSTGDTIDSNGSVEITGGTMFVVGPTSSGDAAFDYDLSATISGGEVIMVGSSGMAQNFTSGTQPFFFGSFSSAVSANKRVTIADTDGNVIFSYVPSHSFTVVQGSSAKFTEGGTYQLIIGGTLSGVSEDVEMVTADMGATISGGTSNTFTASTTAKGGLGGIGSDGQMNQPGQGGDVRTPGQQGRRM